MHDVMTCSRRLVLSGLAALALALPAAAQDSPVLLTVVTPEGREVTFTDDALSALSWDEITTHTRWTEGPQQFRGPRFATLLEALGITKAQAQGMQIVLTALNEFVVEMPAADVYDHQAMLARETNGAVMRVRDKGPLWLVFPRDELPVLDDPIIDERWIWQLSHIRLTQ